MHILIVTFGLEGLSDADYRDACLDEAPAFAALPGLVSKAWLANETANEYGGVYLFRDRDALDAYVNGDLFKGFATDPAFPGLTATAYEILDAPSVITHGIGATNPVAA